MFRSFESELMIARISDRFRMMGKYCCKVFDMKYMSPFFFRRFCKAEEKLMHCRIGCVEFEKWDDWTNAHRKGI